MKPDGLINNGRIVSDKPYIYYSGDTTTKNGVAVILRKEIAGAVIGFLPISDRVALLKIGANPTNLNIIQVYAPTSECTEREIERFFEELNNALKTIKKRVTIIMGDFNAKVGKSAVETIIGEYGLGTRNDRGDRLIQFF